MISVRYWYQLLPHMIQINDARATAAKERRMRNIVDEAGEIVAMASDEHTLDRRSPPPRGGGERR